MQIRRSDFFFRRKETGVDLGYKIKDGFKWFKGSLSHAGKKQCPAKKKNGHKKQRAGKEGRPAMEGVKNKSGQRSSTYRPGQVTKEFKLFTNNLTTYPPKQTGSFSRGQRNIGCSQCKGDNFF